jgi:transposase
MGKCITYVGLDVHKNSIAAAFAEEGGGEVRSYGTINSDLASLDKVTRKLVSRGNEPRFVYEACPCGYKIYRHLRQQNFECIVAVPSLIPKKSGDRIKNDRRDAMMLARLYLAGELTPVRVPSSEDEAMRET